MEKVRLNLSNGKKIDLVLYPEYAPISCENFLSLVKRGFYDGVVFHRIIDVVLHNVNLHERDVEIDIERI